MWPLNSKVILPSAVDLKIHVANMSIFFFFFFFLKQLLKHIRPRHFSNSLHSLHSPHALYLNPAAARQ